MWMLAWLLACASPPNPVPEAAPVEVPEAAEVVPEGDAILVLRVGGPAKTTCTFDDGTVATITVTSRWPVKADFELDGKTVAVGPETPGYAPYEYMGNVYYAWSLSFEALDASWMYSLERIEPELGTPRLARTRAGVTNMASCG